MKYRVLIAEDEQLERDALNHILAGMDGIDMDLVLAANGNQALQLAGAGQIDLALLDIRMPGLDGIAVARELRGMWPSIRIIFITAFDHFDYALEALRLGVDEYLVKPAAPDAVRNTVLRSLQSSGRRNGIGTAGDGADIPGSRGNGTVDRALQYMKAHLAEQISLAAVATAVGASSTHLSHLFGKFGGSTFVHSLCELRVNAATSLLETGKWRIKEVCAMVGFNDQAYFTRVFTKYRGMKPSEVRTK